MNIKPHTENQKHRKYKFLSGFKVTLGRRLLFRFLVLAIIPLITVSLINYYQAIKNLHDTAIESLSSTSELKTAFIKNWFAYRFLDLKSQALHKENSIFLSKLTRAYNACSESLQEFIESRQWSEIVGEHGSDLQTFRIIYDYYDIFLIDTEGNILFTVIGEDDLGVNLFSGELSNSLFSAACRKALNTGKITFSDYEFHAPSSNAVAGFLVSPIESDDGDRIGLIAFQVPIHKIDNLVQDRSGSELLCLFSRKILS